MSRRWKLLIAIVACLAIASLLAFLPAHDDGLDWVRKYGEEEVVARASTEINDKGQLVNPHANMISFTFNSVPYGLVGELKQRNTYQGIDDPAMFTSILKDGRDFVWHRGFKTLYILQSSELNWFERQWVEIKLRLRLTK